MFEEAREELAAWEAHWDRHLDILQHQEAALFERLCAMGYDPRQLFPEYDASDEALATKLTPTEKEAWRRAEAELALAVTTPVKRSLTGAGMDGTDDNEAKEDDGSTGAGSGSKLHRQKHVAKPVVWTEEVVEIDTEGRLPALEAMALTDPLVQQYTSSEEYPAMDTARYPASFAAVTPASVIHAYIYARYDTILRGLYLQDIVHLWSPQRQCSDASQLLCVNSLIADLAIAVCCLLHHSARTARKSGAS